jgi:hypothetical protein
MPWRAGGVLRGFDHERISQGCGQERGLDVAVSDEAALCRCTVSRRYKSSQQLQQYQPVVLMP